MYNEKTNEVTGNQEISFNGTLLSVGAEVKENTNGTQYRLATVKFTDKKGQEQQVVGAIYEKNFQKGVKVGDVLLCTANQASDGKVYIQVSALPGGAIATPDMFGFATKAVAAESSSRIGVVETK